MDKEKFYKTVCRLVEDYFDNFSKKPNYLLVNSQFDFTPYLDDDDLKNSTNEKFKGMMIVRAPDIHADKLIVY